MCDWNNTSTHPWQHGHSSSLHAWKKSNIPLDELALAQQRNHPLQKRCNMTPTDGDWDGQRPTIHEPWKPDPAVAALEQRREPWPSPTPPTARLTGSALASLQTDLRYKPTPRPGWEWMPLAGAQEPAASRAGYLDSEVPGKQESAPQFQWNAPPLADWIKVDEYRPAPSYDDWGRKQGDGYSAARSGWGEWPAIKDGQSQRFGSRSGNGGCPQEDEHNSAVKSGWGDCPTIADGQSQTVGYRSGNGRWGQSDEHKSAARSGWGDWSKLETTDGQSRKPSSKSGHWKTADGQDHAWTSQPVHWEMDNLEKIPRRKKVPCGMCREMACETCSELGWGDSVRLSRGDPDQLGGWWYSGYDSVPTTSAQDKISRGSRTARARASGW